MEEIKTRDFEYQCEKGGESMDISRNYTFREISKFWLELCEIRNKKSTFIKYRNLLENYILQEFGDVFLQDMNQKSITTFLKEQFLFGGIKKNGLSNSTIKSLQFVFKAVIKYAAECNHTENIEVNIDFLAPGSPSISILTETEENILVRHLLEDMDLYKLGILICLYTGIRIGELCALSWEDVNMAECYITINHTVQRLQTGKSTQKTRLHLGMPKSRSSVRIIPIPNFLIKIMRGVRRQYKKAGFIISGSEKLTDPRTMQYKFSKYLKDLNINQVNFHTLRHTFATRCVKVGFDIKTLSEILGHSNVNITLNRYVHSSIDMKREQMQLVNSKWFGKITKHEYSSFNGNL